MGLITRYVYQLTVEQRVSIYKKSNCDETSVFKQNQKADKFYQLKDVSSTKVTLRKIQFKNTNRIKILCLILIIINFATYNHTT